ncbi:MAG: acyl carrier protein [Myxococcales bacterium]|nr:acyl carrier protein [Myxococcales bacterium]
MDIRTSVREFIQDSVLPHRASETFADSDNIFELGFVDSMTPLSLVNFLEQNFVIKVQNEDLEIGNFSSIDRIAAFVESKRARAS